jgi:hypothetical protein
MPYIQDQKVQDLVETAKLAQANQELIVQHPVQDPEHRDDYQDIVFHLPGKNAVEFEANGKSYSENETFDLARHLFENYDLHF